MADISGYPELDSLLPRVAALADRDRPRARMARRNRSWWAGRRVRSRRALKTLATRAPDELGAPSALPSMRSSCAPRRPSQSGAPSLRQADAEAERRSIDLTMPARRRWIGAVHPVSAVIDEIAEIFRGLGFAIALGPEVETDWYNFLALNFPADHPAMDLHDTLYLDAPPAVDEQGAGRLLLRTHTSPVQIRVMHASEPPIRVIMPGMVYRSDAFDPSHAPAFEQIEGLAIDEGVSFVDLKATLTHFARRFFSPSTAVRFRPSFFPFTEPSAEMDVECQLCHGVGLRRLQGHRLDGDPRLRHGAPARAGTGRHRSGALYRVRLRHGAGAHHHAAPRRARHPAAVRG